MNNAFEFTTEKAGLLKELSLLQGVVDRKETMPILSTLLIKSEGSGISILGTDLALSLRTTVPAVVKTPGAFTVHARRLFDIVRALPDEPIRFTQAANDRIVVECGRLKFKLAGASPELFPAGPDWIAPPYRIPAAALKTLIARTYFATSSTSSRYAIEGAQFELFEGLVRMVATDGNRLALVERPGLDTNAPAEGVKLLVPRKALSALLQLAGETDDEVEVGIDQARLYFRLGSRFLVATRLSGDFIAYAKVLPAGPMTSVHFEAGELNRAIRRVALVSDAVSRSIKLTFGMERLELTSQSADAGEGRETIATDYDGPDVSIGFNSTYLTDFLGLADVRIAFDFTDAMHQAQMRSLNEDGYDYRYIVMPQRLN